MFSRYFKFGLFKRCYYNLNLTNENNKLSYNQILYCCKLHGKFKCCKQKMSSWLREQSMLVLKACTKQLEFIAAQRIRRSVQIFHLYTRIYDEVALNTLLRSLRHKFTKNSCNFLVGAVGFSFYNWDQDRIGDEEILSYTQELDSLHKLKDSTVVCSKCHLRLIIDVNQAGIKYCQCPDAKYAVSKAHQERVEWEPFIERRDMLVWRREENSNGLYSYKVYASFDDVSAEDFLQVQIDIGYRKEWDATAKELEIIDTDPMFKESKNSCSDVIYWEMIWPRMFANRDYVYQRRWLHDEESNLIVIASKDTDHPNAPVRTDTYRVTTYWSYMVIRPHKNFHEPGIEFVLTYFDDPGVNIPSAVTSWVAMSGLPDYLCRMREAGKNYKRYKMEQKVEDSESIVEENVDLNVENEIDDQDVEITTSNDVKKEEISQTLKSVSNDFVEVQDELVNVNDSQSNNQRLLDYFFLTKLFA